MKGGPKAICEQGIVSTVSSDEQSYVGDLKKSFKRKARDEIDIHPPMAKTSFFSTGAVEPAYSDPLNKPPLIIQSRKSAVQLSHSNLPYPTAIKYFFSFLPSICIHAYAAIEIFLYP